MSEPFIYSKDFKELKNNLDSVLNNLLINNISSPDISTFYNKGAVDKVIDLIGKL